MSEADSPSKSHDLPSASRFAAPLPDVTQLAAKIGKSVSERGWVRLQVVKEPETWALETLESSMIEISKALGYVVPQTYRNNLIAHIRDEGLDYRNHAVRGHQTNAELSFHSDRCDLNLLLYVATAAQGGELSVISYEVASEALRSEDIDSWRLLFDGLPFDLREERIFPSLKWHWRPVLWQTPEGVRGHYIRRFIADSQRHFDAPRLTTAQLRALDAFDAVLSRLRPAHTFAPEPGELLVVDNYRVMHARNAYRDEGSKGRLALRTWVAPFGSEPLPLYLQPLAGSCDAGVYRGGVGSGEAYLANLGQRLQLSEQSL
ncbi:UNVERIFIED_ORG: hypothetical protein BTE55_09845 [Rhizobium sophorae]